MHRKPPNAATLLAIGVGLLTAGPAITQALGPRGDLNPRAGDPSTIKFEEIVLGRGDLLTGLPGDGPLAVGEVDTWLEDPRNHVPLRPRLPIGLDAGAGAIYGLKDNPLTRAKIELGRQLFFDKRLSVDGSVSCASCHAPEHGFTLSTRFGAGVGGQQGHRNPPVAYNRLLSSRQFLDGRAASLEEQSLGPIEAPAEMGSTHEACVEMLEASPAYRTQFEHVFDDGVTIRNVGRAIASFERALVTGPTAWDQHERLVRFEKVYAEDLADPAYLADEAPELLDEHRQLKQAAAAQPLSASARRGAELFFSTRSGCSQCHAGANFTDERYHNLGVGFDHAADTKEPHTAIDLGRYLTTGDETDRGAFKTPTLRNVAEAAPYMHDGSLATLAEVIDWYDQGGAPNPYLSNKIKPLRLSDQEKQDLVAFLESLTGSLPEVQTGRLPE